MHQRTLVKKIRNRLNIIGGQVNGVRRMLRENRPKKKILYVLLAVEGGIKKTIYGVFDELLRKQIAEEVNRLINDEVVFSQHAETLMDIRKNIHRYSLRELAKTCEALEKMKPEKED